MGSILPGPRSTSGWSGLPREVWTRSSRTPPDRAGSRPLVEAELEIVEATLSEKPAGATHWSVRTMAEAKGVSRMTVHRVWKKYN